MSLAKPAQAKRFDSSALNSIKVRRSAQGIEPTVLTDIYQEETNIVIWQRDLSKILENAVECFIKANPAFQVATNLELKNVRSALNKTLGQSTPTGLKEDIAELVHMFCCLFDLERAGLRMSVLDQAMCPKFHVDRVPCRLVTTYQGVATEWLPHQKLDREKLGAGSGGKPDHQSGLFKHQQDIQSLYSGDVALLKGELWEGNENAGLVHRSPMVNEEQKRLLLTLDFIC